jgi:hypothetical protein
MHISSRGPDAGLYVRTCACVGKAGETDIAFLPVYASKGVMPSPEP